MNSRVSVYRAPPEVLAVAVGAGIPRSRKNTSGPPIRLLDAHIRRVSATRRGGSQAVTWIARSALSVWSVYWSAQANGGTDAAARPWTNI